MTTIIVKNANFAGGKLLHYEPPVSDLLVCSWVGGDDAVCQRNFGTLGDLAMPAGTPVQQADGLFRRFNANNYFQLPTERKASMTVIAVTRDVAPPAAGAVYGQILSSERDSGIDGHNYNGGRRGFVAARGYNVSANGTYDLRAYNYGDNAGTPFAITPTLVANDATPIASAFTSQPDTTGTSAQVFRLTAVAANSALVKTAIASTLPDPDEAGYQLRVGKNYRAVAVQDIDIAFLAVAARILTQAERDAMYASIKRRFTAFGITI